MGLVDRLKDALARKAERPLLARVDTQEHAEQLVLSTIAGGGSATGAWAKGLAVAFGGGACTAAYTYLENPDQFLADPLGIGHALKVLAVKACAGGLMFAGAYLAKSPRPPKIDPGAVIPDGKGGVHIVPPENRPAVAAVQAVLADQQPAVLVEQQPDDPPATPAEEAFMRRTGRSLKEIRR